MLLKKSKIKIKIDIRPMTKSRPRISRSGCFYTPSSKKERELKKLIKKQYNKDLIREDVEINLIFGFNGGRIGDIDNYEKFVLDCLQGTVINNDSQVKKICSEIKKCDEDFIYIEVSHECRNVSI